MKKILLVITSVRESRIADNILSFVMPHLSNYVVTVADFKEMPLPFFDSPLSPSSEDFVPTDPNVIEWTKIVGDADAIVFLVAEYNHSYTPVLKNAIDWLYKEWAGKPVTFIGYGWVGGARAIKHLRDVMGSNIAAKATENEANLRFMKEINLDGNIIDEEATNQAIKTTFEELATITDSTLVAVEPASV